MDAQVEAFYRNIFSKHATAVSENALRHELIEYFTELNPPPDKLVWLRATAFRIGTEYLTTPDNKDANSFLLHTISVIVDALEHTCMV